MSALQDFGIDLILIFQKLSPALDGFMEFITFFGKVEFFMIFIPFLYWIINRQVGLRTFIVLLCVDIIAVWFKLLLHQPRPYWISEKVIRIGGVETSYGIPSTHASDPLAIWGYLSVRWRKGWMWVVTILIVLLISFSRMYMGVHFPHDIVGGWLIGIVILLLIFRYEDNVASWLDNQSLGSRIFSVFLVSLIFIAGGFVIGALISSSPDSSAWASYSTEARSMDHYITLGSALFGAATGYFLMKEHAPFKVEGTWVQKLLRYLLGIVGVVVILYGLDYVFETLTANQTLGYILRYIRYSLTTFWAMFLAPWIFIKLKLASLE